jgi:hypothetical protein
MQYVRIPSGSGLVVGEVSMSGAAVLVRLGLDLPAKSSLNSPPRVLILLWSITFTRRMRLNGGSRRIAICSVLLMPRSCDSVSLSLSIGWLAAS